MSGLNQLNILAKIPIALMNDQEAAIDLVQLQILVLHSFF